MGFHPGYFRHFGVNEKHRLSLFNESVEVIKTAWTSKEPFSFKGKRFQYEDVFLTPKPYQDPHPVIWGSGQSDAAITRAGTYATGWCGDPFPLDRDVFMRQTESFRETAQAQEVWKKLFSVLQKEAATLPAEQLASICRWLQR